MLPVFVLPFLVDSASSSFEAGKKPGCFISRLPISGMIAPGDIEFSHVPV